MKPTYLRKLDALIAEHVMGYERGYWNNFEQKQIDTDWFEPHRQADPASGRSEDVYPIEWVPRFSADVAEAWKVVEKMRKKGFEVTWFATPETLYGCRVAPYGKFVGPDIANAQGETQAEASARAVLLALKIALPDGYTGFKSDE